MPSGEDTAALAAMPISNPSDRASRRSVTASKLLWSRGLELEELQLKLAKMQGLLGDLRRAASRSG
ncbi:hypothetical protein PPTG_06335 [Phytophthora nicotianae INRA-310]|uniref:Uncharacterized protein n=1 Tax=Phytophthora nicotianae (strain INRA-310) TaxID=761204 RepID=W2QV16_PHYN3|nr:hypothetical protein PPTG_06335 [Phytophthora nicotianae INRA-310]ETN16120.1 hypothetical protein PPTG_06335 [Phytophthora nicotianae INRA-310]